MVMITNASAEYGPLLPLTPDDDYDDIDEEFSIESRSISSLEKPSSERRITSHAGTRIAARQALRAQKNSFKRNDLSRITPDNRSIKTVSPNVYRPESAETRFRVDFISLLDRTNRCDTWYALLPARLGHHEALDTSLQALVRAEKLASNQPNVTNDSCLQAYGRAITLVRDRMMQSGTSDDVLLSVALLVGFERTFSWTSIPMRSHLAGISAIMLAQAKSPRFKPTDTTRAMVDVFWAVFFLGSCVLGVPSPFESPQWLDHEPLRMPTATIASPWPIVAQLRKHANQILIRLPRLITLVKNLRTVADPDNIVTALSLAEDLCRTDEMDNGAENELLHHVNILKSSRTHPAGDTVKYSMHFASMVEFEAAGFHWLSRMILYRLCWRLSCLFPSRYATHPGLPSKPAAEASIARMASNALMVVDYASTKGDVAGSNFILHLTATWGALNDFDVFESRGWSPARARVILQQCAQLILKSKAPDPVQDVRTRLQNASELFSGGPPMGAIAFTFRKGASPEADVLGDEEQAPPD